MFITHRPTVTLQLHNFDLFRTCRTSNFCTVAWQLARFQQFNWHDASRGPSATAELLVNASQRGPIDLTSAASPPTARRLSGRRRSDRSTGRENAGARTWKTSHDSTRARRGCDSWTEAPDNATDTAGGGVGRFLYSAAVLRVETIRVYLVLRGATNLAIMHAVFKCQTYLFSRRV